MSASPSESLPQTLGEVVRWVIEETDAMCPSRARLAAYAAWLCSQPGLHAVVQPVPACFSDIHYHVEEAGCRLCTAELEQVKPGTDDGHG